MTPLPLSILRKLQHLRFNLLIYGSCVEPLYHQALICQLYPSLSVRHDCEQSLRLLSSHALGAGRGGH
jgi:hypothetical protein